MRGLSGWMSRLLVLLALGLFAASAGAQTALQPVPELVSHIVDLTGTFSSEQHTALNDKLAAFELAHGSQIVVLLVASTAPEDIASYANRVGNVWKVGRKDIGDGLLLVVAKGEHKLRIEVAKALEGAIPDLAAKRVIDQAITPRFKQGDFAGGIEAGVDQLMALIQHEALPAPAGVAKDLPTGVDAAFKIGWTDLGILTFFTSVAGVIGAGLVIAFALVGAVVGAVSWWIVPDVTITFWSAMGGMVASFVGLVIWGLSLPSSGKNSCEASAKTGLAETGKSRWADSFTSSSGSSSSGWGFFSSGGGGDFGGGGASGDW